MPSSTEKCIIFFEAYPRGVEKNIYLNFFILLRYSLLLGDLYFTEVQFKCKLLVFLLNYISEEQKTLFTPVRTNDVCVHESEEAY